MPWFYYGAKHGLARRYASPLPSGPIIEPFAGSAGYSVYWAEPWRRVLLYDADPEVVATWHALQAPDALDYLNEVERDLRSRRVLDHMLTRNLAGTGPRARKMPNSAFALNEWRKSRARIVAALPRIRSWVVEQADYRDIPDDLRGTWFVDPPYVDQGDGKAAGTAYAFGSESIDYAHLGAWCRERRGLVQVCEQGSADWLPFRPIARQNAMATAASGARSQARVEVVWTQGLASSVMRSHRQRADDARARRLARIRHG